MLLSPAELSIVCDELPVAIWLGRVPSGEVVYTNHAFREVLGIEPPVGAGRGEFVEPYGVFQRDGQPYPEHKMPFERAITARETVVLDDLVIHRRDGRHVHLRVFAKPVFDEAGTITHILEAFTDITREVEAEQARVEGERKLARAQRHESIGQLVAGIAHDFNNLLTVTTLTTSRLLALDECAAVVRDGLRDIETVTGSASDLVRKLLAFARSGPQPFATVELGTLVDSVVALAQRTFERRLELSTACDPRGAWIRGDASQLEQVLMNLLVNARDAISGAGRIKVTTELRELAAGEVETCAAGRYVVLEVTDDGPGIDPKIRERVFEPYFTTKTRGPVKGTGLGLSTVLGIVRAHGGFLEAVGAQPRGTTMRIALPLQERASAPVLDAVMTSAPVVRADGQLVLVIDDEAMVRASTASTLTSLGYRVLEAKSGDQAVELFAAHAHEIELVVLDLVMPGLSATQIYDAVRTRRAEVPVIIVTGSAMTDELQRLLDGGVRAWLQKPFAVPELARAMSAARAR